MSEILEFFRQPDTIDFGMDPYGQRVRLEIEIEPEYTENSSVTIRGRLTRDGQPFPGIAWPRDDGDLDTIGIGIGQAIMGLQIEKDRCGSSIHWEFEMLPEGDGWFSVTTNTFPRIPGFYIFKLSAEGLFDKNPAPAGKIIAFFRNVTGSFNVIGAAEQPQSDGVWVAGSLGSAGPSANYRLRIKFCRVNASGQGQRVPGVFVLPSIPRMPNVGNGGLLIDGRRIALDAQTGDLYLSGYSAAIGDGFLERITAEGAREVIALPGITNHEASTIAVNAQSRTLWARIVNTTYVIDLNTLQIVDRFPDFRPSSMTADLNGEGLWAVVVSQPPLRQVRLSKIGRDGQVIATVPGFTPNGRPGWLAPLRNGGVVSIGTLNRQTHIIATNSEGGISARSARWTVRTLDLDANAETGEVSVITADNRRRGLLQNLNAQLQPIGPATDPRNRFGKISSLMTVARPVSDSIWVGGMQYNPDPPPNTEPGPIGQFGSVHHRTLAYKVATGPFRAISLARTYK